MPAPALSQRRLLLSNSLANLLGQLVYPLLALALVPFYIRHLGVEGYGLVGFFSTLVTLLQVATKGMGAAIQREVASRSLDEPGRALLASFVRTFERAYWIFGVVVGLLLVALSRFISVRWLNVESIAPSTIRFCLVVMATRVALSLPMSTYAATLAGLQLQVRLNIFNAAMAIGTSACCAVAVAGWGNVEAYYLADLVVSAVATVVLRRLTLRQLPPLVGPAFRSQYLYQLARESVGLIWSNGIGGFITQLDRIAISRFCSTSLLGVHTAATAGSRLLALVHAPFLQAVYPQLCQAYTSQAWSTLRLALLRNARVVAIAVVAVAAPASAFSSDILLLWTRNQQIATHGAQVMAISLWSAAFLSFASVLYQVQMASGKVRYIAWFSGLALVWFPAAMWLVVARAAIVGAAWVWFAYCFSGWLFNILATARLPLGRWIRDYLVACLSIQALAAGLTIGARMGADYLSLHRPVGRLLLAMATGVLIFATAVLMAFGRTARIELRGWLNRRGHA